MPKLRFLITFLLFFCLDSGYAQNLIANGNFEDLNVCYERNFACSPSAWWNIKAQPPTWEKSLGYPGNKYMKLCMEINNPPAHPLRDYMQSPLLCPLIKGRKYTITMYVRGKHSDFILPQVYFSRNFICLNPPYSNSTLLKYTPALSFKLGKGNRRKAIKKWVKIEGSYIASGDEKLMVIGNFSTDSTSYFLKYPEYGTTHTWIDDVSLVPEDSAGHLYPIRKKLKDSIYACTFRHSCPDEIPEFFKPPVSAKNNAAIFHYTLGDVNFEFDKASLNPSSDSALKSINGIIKKDSTIKIKIYGYTDSLGSDAYNVALSKKRARAVGEYFMRNAIDPGRMTFQGYGAANPVASNKDEYGRRKNRRVEIYLYK